jgi:Gluconate 2-dehydrogenase subunit 3
MHWSDLSRRLFLQRSCAGIGSAWLASHWTEILSAQEHAHRAALNPAESKLEVLSAEEAVEIEAVAAQIIPTDSTPGAREARVIYFIDRALATFDGDKRKLYARGLRELRSRSRKLFRGNRRFSDLTAKQQIQVLQSIEKTPFFEMVRAHTIAGFFANPEYGGNHDQIGWKHIGFENAFTFEPPFGSYDRDYKQGH